VGGIGDRQDTPSARMAAAPSIYTINTPGGGIAVPGTMEPSSVAPAGRCAPGPGAISPVLGGGAGDTFGAGAPRRCGGATRTIGGRASGVATGSGSSMLTGGTAGGRIRYAVVSVEASEVAPTVKMPIATSFQRWDTEGASSLPIGRRSPSSYLPAPSQFFAPS
jgi:hypothetical protein